MDLPSYISGFIDGEGCFSVSFNYRSKLRTRIEVRPSFSVSQKKYSLSALKKIQDFFKCGGIRYSRGDGTYKYEVRSINDLITKIIPHFLEYPLITAKKNDFENFTIICKKMKSNLHLNGEELRKIIDIAYTMNQSGKKRYIKKDLLRLLAR
jgi:hypothetical protein